MVEVAETNQNRLATELVRNITELLSEMRLKEARNAINDNKYSGCLKDNCWDLIPVIAAHLDDETFNTNPELFECCEYLLSVIADNSNAEEALLELIEQAELAKKDGTKFVAMLEATRRTFSRLRSKRGRSLEWCLNAIESHVKEMDEDEGEEMKEVETRVVHLYERLMPWYETFVDEATKARDRERRDMLAAHLLRLLGRPLARLDMETKSEGAKPVGRSLAECLVAYVSRLVSDCYAPLLRYEHPRCEPICLGVFYYLTLSEEVNEATAAWTPQVYSPTFAFTAGDGRGVLPLATALLREREHSITRKGVLLAHALVSTVGDGGSPLLNSALLDSPQHAYFCRALLDLITYSDARETRELGANVFRLYLHAWDSRGRYLLAWNLVQDIRQCSARAYVIAQYKDMLDEAFRGYGGAGAIDNRSLEWYSGRRLGRLLDVFCSLPDGRDCDLMEHGDQLLACLNLLIYLAVRDGSSGGRGVTGWWDEAGERLDLTFLRPLQQAIDTSRAHYARRRSDLLDEQRSVSGRSSASPEVSVSVGRCPATAAAEMTREQQLHALACALNSIDALEMQLARLRTQQHWQSTSAAADGEYERGVKEQILNEAFALVPTYGWCARSLELGAKAAGYPAVARGLFPRAEAHLVEHARSTWDDRLAHEVLPSLAYNAEPFLIVRDAIRARLEMIPEGWASALAVSARPYNVAPALTQLLRMCDDVCWHAGDRSVDSDWYSRRGALVLLYQTCELHLVQDRSPAHQDTWRLLDRLLQDAKNTRDSARFSSSLLQATLLTTYNMLGLSR